MDFTVNELGHYARRLKPTLERNGFGLVEAVNPHVPGEVLQARIWRDVDGEGVPCGHEVGTLNRQLGHTDRYTLTISDNFLDRERLQPLLTDILQWYVRGAK